MIRPKKLTFSGIGRYVEEQNILFDRMGNLNQVDGLRKETGGSSGTGKSTTFNAMDYLFGVNDISAGVLQSRLTKEGIKVTLEADVDGQEVIISRSKSKGLSVSINGKVEEGSNKKAEEVLDSLIGMPRELFRKTYHKRQKEEGFFLNFTPKETYGFLTRCLNLDEFTAKAEKADVRFAELTDQKKAMEQQREVAFSALKATQDGILGLGLAPLKDFNEENIHALNETYQTHQANYKTVEETHRLDREVLNQERPKVFIAPFDRSNIDNYERAVQILRNKRDELNNAEIKRIANIRESITSFMVGQGPLKLAISAGERAHTDAIEISKEIKKIRDSICPTCEQGWATDAAAQRESTLIERVRSLKELVQKGAEAKTALASFEEQIEALKPGLTPVPIPELPEIELKIQGFNEKLKAERILEKAHQQSESQKSTAIMNAFAEKQKALLERQSSELKLFQQRMESAAQTLNAELQKAQIYKSANDRYNSQNTTFKQNETAYQTKVDDLTGKLALVDMELELAEEAKKVIKSYLSVSFDDALMSIGDEASKIIRNVPNMSNATIQLEGTKELGNGKVKEEVTAIINNDGEVNVPIKSLSGGERSAVDLSVDLAVISLIQERSGKGMDLFILDEPFAGLGTVEIEPSIEMLKNCNVNKKIIIVEHNPEVKQMVESRLLVVREGSTSNIAEAA